MISSLDKLIYNSSHEETFKKTISSFLSDCWCIVDTLMLFGLEESITGSFILVKVQKDQATIIF